MAVKSTGTMRVEVLRERLLASLQIDENLLQRALENASKRLDAKTNPVFAYKGEVTLGPPMEDWSAQAKAADQIMAFAGAFVRKEDVRPSSGFTVEVDQRTGTVRMTVGQGEVEQPALPPMVIDGEALGLNRENESQPPLVTENPTPEVESEFNLEAFLASEGEILPNVKVPKGQLSAEVKKIIKDYRDNA